MSTIIEMRVHMDCAGCESKVKNALEKLKGVDGIDIDMSLQKVTVTGWAEQKKVLKTVRKTGRRAELWQLPYTSDNQNFSDQYYQQHHCNGPVNYYASQPASSYNYYKHGYDNTNRDYYHNATQSSIFGHQTGSTFSDENPNGCSIM
ncbi:Heavy metal-associated isoprenylated plant protein [Quillaja saponaria]|uniref:Heavy metal-associated isoprenylated plant protein n=1 Tax=Quillaja saponaria TaxID=32244 RepID=A0AAD7VMK4_QUISA|nr:Heavy metal-associated isoprenylated plant protein [Quillaja saponaria]